MRSERPPFSNEQLIEPPLSFLSRFDPVCASGLIHLMCLKSAPLSLEMVPWNSEKPEGQLIGVRV